MDIIRIRAAYTPTRGIVDGVPLPLAQLALELHDALALAAQAFGPAHALLAPVREEVEELGVFRRHPGSIWWDARTRRGPC